jgi:hypothetical protein
MLDQLFESYWLDLLFWICVIIGGTCALLAFAVWLSGKWEDKPFDKEEES